MQVRKRLATEVPELPLQVAPPPVSEGVLRLADLVAYLRDEAHVAARSGPEGVHVYSAYMGLVEALTA